MYWENVEHCGPSVSKVAMHTLRNGRSFVHSVSSRSFPLPGPLVLFSLLLNQGTHDPRMHKINLIINPRSSSSHTFVSPLATSMRPGMPLGLLYSAKFLRHRISPFCVCVDLSLITVEWIHNLKFDSPDTSFQFDNWSPPPPSFPHAH